MRTHKRGVNGPAFYHLAEGRLLDNRNVFHKDVEHDVVELPSASGGHSNPPVAFQGRFRRLSYRKCICHMPPFDASEVSFIIMLADNFHLHSQQPSASPHHLPLHPVMVSVQRTSSLSSRLQRTLASPIAPDA